MNTASNNSNSENDTSGNMPANALLPLQNKILSISFNQDYTGLALGTLSKYSIFEIDAENNVTEIYSCASEEIHIIERLLSSSLIAMVSKQIPSKLVIYDFKRNGEICACTYSKQNQIRAIRINRSRLIVCFENSIYIHSMRDMKLMHKICDIQSNTTGLSALSTSTEKPYLAYPGSQTIGEIQIFDTINLKPVCLINAHNNPLVAIAFDASGTLIASASTRGTLIRIHNTSTGLRIAEFRRGTYRSAHIYSLAFSPNSLYLATSSDTGTIHVFRLPSESENAPQQPGTWLNTFRYVFDGVAYFLPTQTSEVLKQDRAFATVHSPATQNKTIIAMRILNQTLNLFVVGYDGLVYTYKVNTDKGGECKEIHKCTLINPSELPQTPQTVILNESQNVKDEPAQVCPPNKVTVDENNVPSMSIPIANANPKKDKSNNGSETPESDDD